MIYAQRFDQEQFRDLAEDMSPRLVTMLYVLRFRPQPWPGQDARAQH